MSEAFSENAFSYQIVAVRLCYFNVVKLAVFDFFRRKEINFSVNVRRVEIRSAVIHEPVVIESFGKHLKRLSDERFIVFKYDFLLRGIQFFEPCRFNAFLYLFGKIICGCAFFSAVLKEPRVEKLRFFQKFRKRVESLFRFSGEARYKRRTDRDAGYFSFELFYKREIFLARALSTAKT